ncbi:MAG: ABC transporter substrate-binding protein, partial [Nitrososphaerales archaeon]
MVASKKLTIYSIIAVAIIVAITVTFLQSPRTVEPLNLRIGYLGIVDTVPVFVAMEKGYFEEEGFTISSTRFQSSNQLAEAVINGDVDYAAVVSSSVVFSIEQRVPGTIKVISTVTHPSERPFSSILIRNNSSLTLEDLQGKKLALFPGSTSQALSKIAFRNLMGEDFNAEYLQMPPNLWLDALSQGQVDAVVSYEPFATVGIERGAAKILYSGLYEKQVMDNAPTAFTIVSS